MPKRFKYIAGIDEAGRGPLAGPVVAGCVVFKDLPDFDLQDSKRLSSKKRESLFFKIKQSSWFSFGLVNAEVIDEINILNAAHLAFSKAIKAFLGKYQIGKEDILFIIDGPFFKPFLGIDVYYNCVVKADTFIPEVSAASILAKVLRDKIMISYGKVFPCWGFSRHKGYPTLEHRNRIKINGLSPLHRRSFGRYLGHLRHS